MTKQAYTTTCHCGKRWGDHHCELRPEHIKKNCAWCGIEILQDEIEYSLRGNCCLHCSGRAENVVKELMTSEEADIELSRMREIYSKTK